MEFFINAVVLWLSDIPTSPIFPGDSVAILCDPKNFADVISYLLELEQDCLTSEIYNFKPSIYYSLKSRPVTEQILDMVDILEDIDFEVFFSANDIETTYYVCLLMYLIGTQIVRKDDNINEYTMGFLNEEDRICIEKHVKLHSKEKTCKYLVRDLEKFDEKINDEQRDLYEVLRRRIQNVLVECQSLVNDKRTTNTSEETYVDSILWENRLLLDVLNRRINMPTNQDHECENDNGIDIFNGVN